VLEREHPAPRRAQEVDQVEAEVGAQRVELVEQQPERPRHLLTAADRVTRQRVHRLRSELPQPTWS
jgi:hypothetical protein